MKNKKKLIEEVACDATSTGDDLTKLFKTVLQQGYNKGTK